MRRSWCVLVPYNLVRIELLETLEDTYGNAHWFGLMWSVFECLNVILIWTVLSVGTFWDTRIPVLVYYVSVLKIRSVNVKDIFIKIGFRGGTNKCSTLLHLSLDIHFRGVNFCCCGVGIYHLSQSFIWFTEFFLFFLLLIYFTCRKER